MPINVKGHMVVNEVVEKTPSPPVEPTTFKWNSIKTTAQTEEVVAKPVVRKRPHPTAPPLIPEQPSTYHHQVEGDLHKLINKKSDYLTDMLDFND